MGFWRPLLVVAQGPRVAAWRPCPAVLGHMQSCTQAGAPRGFSGRGGKGVRELWPRWTPESTNERPGSHDTLPEPPRDTGATLGRPSRPSAQKPQATLPSIGKPCQLHLQRTARTPPLPPPPPPHPVGGRPAWAASRGSSPSPCSRPRPPCGLLSPQWTVEPVKQVGGLSSLRSEQSHGARRLQGSRPRRPARSGPCAHRPLPLAPQAPLRPAGLLASPMTAGTLLPQDACLGQRHPTPRLLHLLPTPNSSQEPDSPRIAVLPISQMRKRRLREIKSFVPVYVVGLP